MNDLAADPSRIENVIAGEDIICFSHAPWHGPWKSPQQIMSLLAESNRVLYVGPRVTLRDAFNRFRMRATPLPVLERVRPGLFIYHEPRLLARVRDDRPLAKAYNKGAAWVRFMHIRYLVRRLNFGSPIVWILDPMLSHVVGFFQEKALVYHVLDNYVEFLEPTEASGRAAIARHEERMLKLADVIFAVSRPLHEHCLKYNPNSVLVPNGVNYDYFQTTIASGTLPSDLQAIPRPIIGYVGAIQSDMDIPLLDRLAEQTPDASLVFVGPEELGSLRTKFDALLTRPNVHYLGAKAVRDIPHYINACAVCILPCLANRSTVDSDQIKLYEYLACGRPIVSTDLPCVQRFSHVIRIARNADEFLAHVRVSLGEDASCAELRKRVASQHSWRHRVATLSQAIAERIDSRVQNVGECR